LNIFGVAIRTFSVLQLPAILKGSCDYSKPEGFRRVFRYHIEHIKYSSFIQYPPSPRQRAAITRPGAFFMP